MRMFLGGATYGEVRRCFLAAHMERPVLLSSLFAAACCGCNPAAAAASTVFFSLWIAAAAVQTAATVSACSQPNTPEEKVVVGEKVVAGGYGDGEGETRRSRTLRHTASERRGTTIERRRAAVAEPREAPLPSAEVGTRPRPRRAVGCMSSRRRLSNGLAGGGDVEYT
jgi:hypothetical protein